MSIEALLYARLNSQVSLVTSRIYPLVFKQATAVPALRYTKISTEYPQCMSATAGFTRTTFQIDVITLTHATLLTTTAQVIACLQRYRSSTDGIQDCFVLSEQNMWDDETLQFRTIIEVEIIHS